MIYYNRGGEIDPTLKRELEDYFGGGLESRPFGERPDRFRDIEASFIHNGEDELIFMAQQGGNSESPENFGTWLYLATKNGFSVKMYLKNDISENSSKNTPLAIYSSLGIDVVPSNRWRNVSFIDAPMPQYIQLQSERTIRFVSHSLKGGAIHLEPKQSFNVLPMLIEFSRENNYALYMDDFNESEILGQRGPSNKVAEILNSEDIARIDPTFEIPENNTDTITTSNNAREVPVPQPREIVIRDEGSVPASRTNNHEIWVAELHNELVEEYNESIEHISNDTLPNSLFIDNYIIFTDESGVRSAKIFEVKSNVSNTYYGAVGQLLTYRNRLIRTFGQIENIELILVIPENHPLLESDFSRTLEELEITIITK